MSESLFGGNNNYNYEDDNLKEYPKENSNTKLLPNEVDKYLDGWKLEEDSVGIYYKHPCSTEKFGAIRIIFEDGTSEYVPKYNVNLESNSSYKVIKGDNGDTKLYLSETTYTVRDNKVLRMNFNNYWDSRRGKRYEKYCLYLKKRKEKKRVYEQERLKKQRSQKIY